MGNQKKDKPDTDPQQPGHSEDAPGQNKPEADQDLPTAEAEPKVETTETAASG